MSAKRERILAVLQEDLMPLEDIHACMVARKNLEGITPLTDDFKREVTQVWEVLQSTMNDLFDIISHYGEFGLDKIYYELGDFDVLFYILPGSDNALVAVVPALANRGLLEVELENARRRIKTIIDEPQ